MFNPKPLAVVIASALYVGAVAHAAGIPATEHRVSQIKMADLQKHAGNSSANQSVAHQGRPGGVNQQVRPASSRAKFIAEPDRTGQDVYIVRLHDLPVATYDGRVKGYAATAKSVLKAEAAKQSSWQGWLNKGKDLLGLATEEKARIASYKNYLNQKQQDVLNAARSKGISAAPRVKFTDALNGFTLKLTQAQAQALAELPQVAFVQRSEMLKLHTDRGPEFIGAKEVWVGNTVTNLQEQGDGMVVGILDTGINTDHPSFADVGADGYDHENPLGNGNYLGDCASGVLSCNDKLIGVWSWPVITNDFAGIRPASGEDYNGHGSHTAGTVAGNVQYDVPLLGSSLGDGDGMPTGFTFAEVSGVAPHANIVAYQVCIPDGGCPTEAVVKAFDQAIADGVDVINFSIGGSERFPWEDATELAFLSAREAGISVAVSAGNAGTTGYNDEVFYSISHSAPWAMVVAATTHDRVLDVSAKTLALSGGDTPAPEFPTTVGTEYGGVSEGGINGTLVEAADFGDELCANEFAPGTFNSSQIVVCKRGQIARVQKAFNVQAGGAGGFILVNVGFPDDQDDLVNDVYPLPGIQLHSWDGQALISWMNDGGSGHQADISATTFDRHLDASEADKLADFSSRGPVGTFAGHLSPNVSAPGVAILAPYADEHPFNPNSALSRDWAMIDGTSMASPHVAGAMTLVRAAHPDWTAAEVQSALQLTAVESVSHGHTEWDTAGRRAAQHRAGAGRIDVKAAIDSGLVMDESASDFLMANPRNGGDVKQLNLPQLVNNNCRDICTWTRTFRATRDGSWTVSADNWVYDRWNTGEGEMRVNGGKLEATPASFTLRAGESRTISFRADLTDTQFRRDARLHVNSSEEVELWTDVRLTPSGADQPALHLPVSVNFDHGPLPKSLDIAVHRDNGSYRLADAALPAMNSVSYRAFGATKADIETISLPQDIDHVPYLDDGDASPGHIQTLLLNVPANSARLVVDVLANENTTAIELWRRGWMTVAVGIDANGNGAPDVDDELLCVSNTEIELNYCSITNPDAGQYWVLLSNVRTGSGDGEAIDIVDTYKVATAVVPANPNHFSASGASQTDGNPVDIDLSWQLDELTEGDVAYAGFDVGTASMPGKVGFVPVKLRRGVNDVSLHTSQTRARGGDVIDVTLHVLENLSGADRSIDLSSSLPAGLTLVPGSVKVSSKAQKSNLSVNGQTIAIRGTQQHSEGWARDYMITTSEDDASCRTPVYRSNNGASSGGFVGLVKNLGFTPDFGGNAFDWTGDAFLLPLANYWGDGSSYELYNNVGYGSPVLRLSPQGWVTLDGYAGMPAVHQKFPYYSSPYTPMIGVLWKGEVSSGDWMSQTGAFLGTPLNVDYFNPSNSSGMLMAMESNSGDLVLEWVNARSQEMEVSWSGANLLSEGDDRYSFNLILNPNTRFGEGQFELMMAYDDLNFATDSGKGSIGLHGHYGPLDIFGYPYQFESGKSFAYNDLKSKLKNNLVVCYDYVGPESTQFDVSFQVRIAETASGKTLPIQFASTVTGMGTQTVSANIEVAGTLTVMPIANQTVVENTTLEGIEVVYHDVAGTPNAISVSGDHVQAVMFGHKSGDKFNLIPEANFEGSTEVTVTVSDVDNPADKSSTTFTLVVTKGTDVTSAESGSGGGGGGSVGAGALLLLALFGYRRRSLYLQRKN